MERAFTCSGTPLPPWRGADYLLSNWLPASARDEPVAAESPPPTPTAADAAAAGARATPTSPLGAGSAPIARPRLEHARSVGTSAADALRAKWGRGPGSPRASKVRLSPVDALLLDAAAVEAAEAAVAAAAASEVRSASAGGAAAIATAALGPVAQVQRQGSGPPLALTPVDALLAGAAAETTPPAGIAAPSADGGGAVFAALHAPLALLAGSPGLPSALSVP
jgi:hypothetical protein